MTDYLPRITDAQIAEALTYAGAVIVDGARAVGKTESARRVARSEIRLDGTDPLAVLSREQPSVALEGEPPRLIDEWQLVPEIWNEVRHEVDRRKMVGQFVLSGSAAPDHTPLRHSGAGRFAHVRMRTLTFHETGESTGKVSLSGLLEGRAIETTVGDTPFDGVISRIVRGGWPGWSHLPEAQALARSNAYVGAIVEHDFPEIAGTSRDPRRFLAVLRAVAALVSQPSAMAAIRRRIQEDEHVTSGEQLTPILMDIGSRMYLLEDQQAWSPKLRSRTTPMQTPKRHLADPSLAATLLGATSERLITERETLGHLFESQVFHDVAVYAQANRARGVYHYRDVKGRDEIDIVVEGAKGDWVAIEVKLGQASIDEAAAQLHRVTAKIDRPPAHKVVVTPTGVAHRRADGVLVVPLTTLGP